MAWVKVVVIGLWSLTLSGTPTRPSAEKFIGEVCRWSPLLKSLLLESNGGVHQVDSACAFKAIGVRTRDGLIKSLLLVH